MRRPSPATLFSILVVLHLCPGCSKSQPEAVHDSPPDNGPIEPAAPAKESRGGAAEAASVPRMLANAPAESSPAAFKEPAAATPHYYRRVVVVGIGIEKYRVIPERAKYAENDVRQTLKLFHDRFGYETIPLIGSNATQAAIRATLDKYKNELGEKDSLIVYFAGHGQVIDLPSHGSAGYLVPFDAKLDLETSRSRAEWTEQAIDMHALTREFEDAAAQHVLFIVDACCSGFMTRRGNDLARRADLHELMGRRSRTVLAASADRSSAFSDNDTGHGYFSKPVLDVLGGQDAMSVTEMFLAARTQTVKDSGRRMLPQRGEFGTEYGEFVFIPLSVPAGQVKKAVTNATQVEVQRTARLTQPAHLFDLLDAPSYRSSTRRAELERDWQQRLDRFRENASLGDSLAMCGMSICLARGMGTEGVSEKTDAEAYRTARKSFESGRPAGKFALGLCLLNGTGVAKSTLAARELLDHAMAENFVLAALPLADLLTEGKPTPEQLRKADGILARAESEGVPGAVARRASLALKGTTPPTPEEATKWVARLKVAVDAGLPAAQHQTYQLLTAAGSSLSDEQNTLGIRCLTKAAESGIVDAQYELAREYYQKDYKLDEQKNFRGKLKVPQDFVAARTWALAASEQEHVEATKMLAMIYVLGDGVKVDTGLAQKYYRQARAKSALDWTFTTWFTPKLHRALYPEQK